MEKLFLVSLFWLGVITLASGTNNWWCANGNCHGIYCGDCNEVKKREVEDIEQEKRVLNCPSDCSCIAYFGECCETIGFYVKYFAYVINLAFIPEHITEAEWRSAYPQFGSRQELQTFFNTFTWPEVPCRSGFGTCPN